MEQEPIIAAPRYVRPSILLSNRHLEGSRYSTPNPRANYHVDPPPNYSSPNWIAAILDLECGRVMQTVTGLHPLLEVENVDKDIRIQHPSFLEFLLDRTRSRNLFVDLDEARVVPRDAPAIIVRWIFIVNGT